MPRYKKGRRKSRRAKVIAQRILDRGSPINLTKNNYGVATADGRCVGCAVTAFAVACDKDFLANKVDLAQREPPLPRSCLGGERVKAVGMYDGVFYVVDQQMFDKSESSDIIRFFDGSDYSGYKKQYRSIKTTRGLLNAICRNIVKNNGHFVIEDFEVKS